MRLEGKHATTSRRGASPGNSCHGQGPLRRFSTFLSTVKPVRTCSVLRCQKPGSTFVVVGQKSADLREVYVCPEHEAEIESGANWDLRGDQVLMDHDIAPVLESWSLRPSMGSDGFTLVLEAAGLSEPVEIFLTTPVSKSLALFLYPSSGLPLPAELMEALRREEADDAD